MHPTNGNLYDISISQAPRPPVKKKYSGIGPRRVGSMSNLADQKRPNDYYLQKINSSSISLPKQASPRNSDSPVDSKDSDDASSVNSTPFDNPDSRLSSITMNTLYSNRASEASDLEKPGFSSIDEKATEDEDQMQSSLSTVTLHDPAVSVTDLSLEPLQQSPIRPKYRAASTPNMVEQKNLPKLTRQMSETSSFMLSRSKTRFYNAKESKERKQLRKKLYEENDDDEVLCNDMDLVFNVPVIKNNGDVYRSAQRSSSSSLLSRDDITESGAGKYPNSTNVKPCPLPGKLSQSRLNLSLPAIDADASIPEDDAVNHSSFFSIDNDGEICHNISDFYSQRSLSYSHTAKAARDQDLAYKLPNYVKSQTSTEEINLVSPEKLEALDQTRPINLPPKNTQDKAKHGKELTKVLTDFESATKLQSLSRKTLNEQYIVNQQTWFSLMIDDDEKIFNHKLHADKNKLRALNWDSPIPDKYRFEYFMRILGSNLGLDFVEKLRTSLPQLEAKYSSLSSQVRLVKDAQFKQVIDNVLSRPLFVNHLSDVNTIRSNFSLAMLKENFLRLLYLKSYSEGGLKKHQELFLIPTFLILFQNSQSLHDIYVLIEMFEASVFDMDIFVALNKKLACWKDLSLLSSSSTQYKILKRFNSLDEFEYLSSSTIFELMIQLNDKLPLSLSAPSTPVVAQNTFASLSKVSLDSESSGSGKTPDAASAFDCASLKSSSISLVGMFLQLIVIYSKSRYKKHNLLKVYQAFLLTIFKFYHINWNSCMDLVQGNKSIKLNNTSDQLVNLESFVDKWKEIFKKM